ncbi:hypothetical protein [Xylella fastidiosa]|uniref:hypothetical protein n=1 Tax=Xylella fastidiosa TaxID=2371 RepID=UPI000FEC60DD|nr:hypothetical protein [Xylella fastidiosa]MRU28336.1 hypothetical protein [Xylella fastidiosa subsp. multiplex]MRU30726.1 hypothetical protein [Xylella fastidiosa subsp. multiplex]UIT53399.1 transposase [Xylella fastidiosa subsp. fastidiosa]WLE28542.1 transposase [Xylella fastidiosa subsp. multiplex]
MGSYVLLTYLLTQSEDTEVQATGFDGKKTLMIQKVLSQPHWQRRFTPRDYTALTPLIWEYVNPYGRLDLDMMRGTRCGVRGCSESPPRPPLREAGLSSPPLGATERPLTG